MNVINFQDPQYKSIFLRMVRLSNSKSPWCSQMECVYLHHLYMSSPYNDFSVKLRTYALIEAISLHDGMLGYDIYPISIHTEEFQAFVRKLSAKYEGKLFAIFLDNLSVHKTNLSKELFRELQLHAIFNIQYSPQFNGIESYFSILKSQQKNFAVRESDER